MATEKYGIDISNHNGSIDWSQVATEKSFIIVRAGYGDLNGVDTHIDPRAVGYIQGAQQYNIAVAGIYWYSYTRTAAYAATEAKRACKFLRDNGWNVPIYFDFELSYEGYQNTPEEVRSFCTFFTNEVVNEGYTAGVYFDPNYYSNYYGSAFISNLRANGVKIWFAQWNVQQPMIDCDVWQYSSTGSVAGITGNVDLNTLTKGNLSFTTEYNIKSGKAFYLLTNTEWINGSGYQLFINYFNRLLASEIRNLFVEPTHYNNTSSTYENRVFTYLVNSLGLLMSDEFIISGCVHNVTATRDTSSLNSITIDNVTYTVPQIVIDIAYNMAREISSLISSYLTYFNLLTNLSYEEKINKINIKMRNYRVYWNITDDNISETYSDIQYYFTVMNIILNNYIISGSITVDNKPLKYYGLNTNILSIKTTKDIYNKFWNFNDFLTDKYIWIDDNISTVCLNTLETISSIVSLNDYTVPQTVIYLPNNGYLADYFRYNIKSVNKKLKPIYYSRVF